MPRNALIASLAGLLAILLWSTSIGIWRLATDSLGPFAAGAVGYGVAGLIGTAILVLRPSMRGDLRQMSFRHVLPAAAMFITCNITLTAAVGLAVSGQQVLEVAIINYLWPGLTLVLSIPLLANRPRPLLPVGIVLALAGVILATFSRQQITWAAFVANVHASAWPYLMALTAAVSWALYSNLARRWNQHVTSNFVPLMLLGSGTTMAIIALIQARPIHWAWTAEFLWPLAYLPIFPALLGYVLWNVAMRRGNIPFVASAAYLTPLLSTCFTCLLLRVTPAWTLWIACALVIAGAVICKLSVRQCATAGDDTRTTSG